MDFDNEWKALDPQVAQSIIKASKEIKKQHDKESIGYHLKLLGVPMAMIKDTHDDYAQALAYCQHIGLTPCSANIERKPSKD